MPSRTTKQGDYLVKLANEEGFFDHRTVWEDAQNKGLKEKRKNPNVLAPGDEVFVPEKAPKKAAAATGQTHRFQVTKEKNLLRLVLEDFYFKPIANAKCELTVDGKLFQVVSGGDGKIEQEIPITAQQAELIVREGNTPLKNIKLKIEIGHLDPVEEVSGQKARLSNLGYFLGSPDTDDEARFQSAVEEFQCDNGLKVDGKCGAGTQAKLKQIHGC
jgi:hypothetical protein